ncbi:MAG: M20/M25/M40 family metallo-hydrolase, partial [Thermoguttaceae bacterium]
RPVEVKNVLGLLPGEGPHADEIIVVGAHYDHLGYRERNGERTVFNGANDNASGTAAMLEIARLLARRGKKLPRSVLFIAFTAEERGLVGSFFYVKHPVVPLEKTVAMVNLDMVGRLEADRVMATGVGTSNELAATVTRVAESHDLRVTAMPGAVGGSDHMAFYTHEIPVVHFATMGGWGDYHKPTDDLKTLDCGGISRIAAMSADVVIELAELKERPRFQDSGWGGTIVRNLFRWMGAAASSMAEPKKEAAGEKP